MDQLQDIRAFVAIVDLGSQSAAARQLGRSVQSISRSLGVLERSLGVQLIRRTTRRSSTTEVGRSYYRRVQAALAELDAAGAEASSQLDAPRGLLRVAAPVQFAASYVVPLVAAFMQRYPGMEVDLTASDRFVDLIEGDIDLAIRAGELPDSELAARRLGALRLVVFGAPAYFARHGRPERPEDLASHQCLVRTTHGNDAHWPFSVDGRLARVKVSGRFRADSTSALYAAVTAGMGLFRTPLWQIRPLLDSGQAELVLTGFEAPPLPLHAVWPAARGSFARAKLFADFAAEHLPPL
ncbi:DNA-binding transcriptional LysR family regulator [Variovorax sp. TBS-050B]|jgi:DNA-binding transcriptional LysR family regulator|uniref:LysR family transcriptional regulator n=1 Tax=Variovorax sp. TBS-050B TaxID=2940551 RepID=UPI0024736CCF|nr:LysR family transcriptional regulator [Variovorax sp. TBS-050B]MDH6592915.1 DNA-binding transcriptional LysR family regulator [Variovorax sp. TBS-050B]